MSYKETIEAKLQAKRQRLAAYLARETEMLTGGVQSYGIGSRNITRYNTELSQIREAIKELEAQIAELEAQLNGKASRKAVGVIPRDW